MSGRPKILEVLRRRKRALARAVLPLVTAGWLSSAASLCFGMTADGAEHEPLEHEHAQHEGQAHEGHEPGGHGHGSCPHCPQSVADAPSASHAACSALVDDISDNSNRSGTLKSDLVYTLPGARFDAPAAVPLGDRAYRLAKSADIYRSAVPLNLRHCVFLI